jgi:hypothetical protein
MKLRLTPHAACAITPVLWFVAEIALCFIPAFAEGLENSQDSPTHGALHPPVSIGTETVSVQFGPTLYNIPRNYLAGVTQARDANSYAAFTIRVLLPDFTPRNSENASQFDVVGWHNKFSALFEYGRHPRTAEEILEYYLKLAEMSKNDFKLVGSDYKLYENAKFYPSEIYTKETPNGLLFFICGATKNGTPSPSCTVNEAFSENIGVIYHFSRNYLEQASDIDRKLRALLKSFEKK